MPRMSRAVAGACLAAGASVLFACSAELGETPPDGSEEALGTATAANILFPGDAACGGGCERSLAGTDLFIPASSGRPWGETYKLGTDKPVTVGGFSSGRIALLRRLALKNDASWAVMLDPSWDDGSRDFLDDDNPQTRPSTRSTTGPAIVKTWLGAQKDRRFLLVYSTRSQGWSGYAALRDDPAVAARVTVCAVSVNHADVPNTVGRTALTSPEKWIATSCNATPWDCAKSAFKGKQYLTCDGNVLRKCEGTTPIPILPEHRCKTCLSQPPVDGVAKDDVCAPQ